jgi:large subunit ribosomal protein L9
MIQLILLERVEKLGQMGDVVTVRPGYARNFLIPQKKAMRATKANVESFANRKIQLEADNIQNKQEAEKIAGKLEGLSIIVVRQSGESGQLYGSVNSRDIADGITQTGVTILRTQVTIPTPIKYLGLHEVRVTLHPEISVFVTVNVAKSLEEGKMQAEKANVSKD